MGCARQDAPTHAIEQLRTELTKVQADRDRLEERVMALENADQKRADGERRPGKMADPGSDGRVLPVVRIGAQADGRLFEVDGRNDDGDASASTPVGSANGSARANRDRGRPMKPPTDGKRDYEAAILLARNKQYDKALDALTTFLVRYPDHELSDEAMYWRGECLYGQGANGRAAEQLQGLLARFPQSDRVPDALLRLGSAQKRLGAAEQAQRTFADLKQRYPKSDAARQVPNL
jgi:tol-pal system protein YbgF